MASHGGLSLSRRQLIAGAAALAAAGSLTGCMPSAAAARQRLDFWHLLSGGDGVTMTGLIDELSGASDDYAIEQTVLAWGTPYYTKLAMSSAGGRAPDVAIMHASRVSGYAPGGLLDPWDLDRLADLGVDQSTFNERIWRKGFSGDALYSVALDSHPFVMFTNTDICDRAGVLTSDGVLDVDSPEAFFEAGRAIQSITGGHGLSYGYLGSGAQLWRLFATIYAQQGAEMDLSGSRAVVDEQAAVTALEFMRSLLDDTVAARNSDEDAGIAEFATGGSGLLFTGVWELRTMQEAGLPLGAQPIPTMFGTPAAYADSHSFVLPHQSRADPARRDASYAFVAALLKGSLGWAEAGHVPAYLPVVESPGFAALGPQASYASAADIITYDPPAWFSGSGSNFQSYFLEYVQGVVLAGDDPATGWRAFVSRLDALLAQANPVTGA